jgi:4-amino-4-deoxy-L-arabinose transferase-like glycosyltransferase
VYKGKKHYQKVNILGFITIMLIGLGFKLLFIEHPLESDDTTYMKLAELVSAESFSHPETQLYFRTGILLPLHLLIKISGYSIFTYYLFSVGFSMLLLFSILLLAKELFGIKIAWLTGILYVSSYLIGFQSTNLLPDMPAFFWATISLYLSFRYISGNGKKYFLILSALAGFMAYLCKEPVLVFFLAIPVFELFKNKSVKYSLRFSTCLTGLWVLESLIYLMLTGDFLIRLKTFSTGVSDWIVNQPEVSLPDQLPTYLNQPMGSSFSPWE